MTDDIAASFDHICDRVLDLRASRDTDYKLRTGLPWALYTIDTLLREWDDHETLLQSAVARLGEVERALGVAESRTEALGQRCREQEALLRELAQDDTSHASGCAVYETGLPPCTCHFKPYCGGNRQVKLCGGKLQDPVFLSPREEYDNA